MSVSELPVIDHPRQTASDLTVLSKALAASISTHDVRSDHLNRALYATDASVYQIVPLMVAFPATAADVVAAMQVCAGFRCRSRPGEVVRPRPVSRSGRE